MKAATWPRDDAQAERLLVVRSDGSEPVDGRIRDLPTFLRGGDLLVLNDAATLPASIPGTLERRTGGRNVELRLVGRDPDGHWNALVMGDGDWHQRTEDRPLPPPLAPGDRVAITDRLSAVLVSASPRSARLWRLSFAPADPATLWSELYRAGSPIQYSYLQGALALWHVQNRYASRPWAVEMPSAGRPLTWELLVRLASAGVHLATLTHAAGISSTGDAALDHLLPLPEHYELPERTVSLIEETRKRGGRVIAVGTSVVRALEGCVAERGQLIPGGGITALRLDARSRLHVVDGLLTGMHEPTASHFDLLQALVSKPVLDAAYVHAEREGYLCHEFGDSTLVLPPESPDAC